MVLRRIVLGLAGGFLASTALAQTGGIQPYAPLDGSRPAEIRAFSPVDFRPQPSGPAPQAIAAPTPAAQPATIPQQVRTPAPIYAAPEARPAAQPVAAQPYVPDYRPRPPEARPPEAKPVQDFRPATAVARPAAIAAPATTEERPRYPVYEAKPGVVDPRVMVPRKEEYIDYKAPTGGTLDFRPGDYRAIDDRTMDYRSQANRTADQKVNDPRLKEKGPEEKVALDCKAIQYRAVECNFLDYREIDPKLQELFARYPEVSFGIVPREYAKDTTERWQPLLMHLSAQIGLRLSLKVANDYQALMDAQRAGQVHIALYSPVAFARSRQAGVKLETVAVEANADGSKGGHTVIYALAPRGQAPRIDDVRGKSLGLVDPNSISGYFVPRMMLNAQKIDPDVALSKQIFTGSHDNALLALSQGLVDLAVGHWVSDEDSTLARMLAKGTLKHADGTPMRREDFRIVMKSDAALNGPVAMLSEMPEDLKATIRRALLEAPMRDRAAFEKVYDGRTRWEAIDTKAYDTTAELLRFMDESRARSLPRQQAAR